MDVDQNQIPQDNDHEIEEEIQSIVMDADRNYVVINFNVEAIPDIEYPSVEVDVNELFEEVGLNIDVDEEENRLEMQDDELINVNAEEEEPVADSTEAFPQGRKRNRVLSNIERWKVYYALLGMTVNGKLRRTATTEVANMMEIFAQTVRRIWAIHKKTPQGSKVDVSHSRSNCGRKKLELNLARILEIPLHQRTTLRALSFVLGIYISTLHRLLKRGLMRRHSNAIRPHLKAENKLARLKFCLSMIDMSNFSNDVRFINMYNYIHINEKWFYMTKKKKTYYLFPSEEDPLRTCQSKNFIRKVMFLVAMARPRFDSEGNEVFSTKIGVFPFVTQQQARRRSRHKVAGTLEMKLLTSIVKEFLIEKVIPAIQKNWPRSLNEEVIFIQQDNARTHVHPNDQDFQLAASQSGLNIRLIYQPPNSPDMNILDLGFFSAIQALQHKECPKSVEGLVNAVFKSFNDYSSQKVNHVWLTLQTCMLETMKIEGSNRYKIPHINKLQLEREGKFPVQISCDPQVVMDAINILG